MVITQDEITRFKESDKDEQEYMLTAQMYKNRERLVGETELKDLDFFFENINVDLNMLSHRGLTLLPLAVDFNAPAVVKYLLDKGLDSARPLADGSTLLQFAEKKLQEALDMGRKPDSHITKCAEQSIELLKALK